MGAHAPARAAGDLRRGGGFGRSARASSARFGGCSSGVNLSTLLLFTGQLSAMLAGGLHLARILSSLAAETTNKHFKKALTEVREAITAGNNFADALAQHPHIFDRLYVAVVRAGEISGSLPIVLDTLTVYLEKTAQLRRKVIGAITYPAVILSVAILIVFIMMVKLVPIFESGVRAGQYPAARSDPRAHRGQQRGPELHVHGLPAVRWPSRCSSSSSIQTEAGRRLLDACKLRVPLFGPLIRKAIMARACRTLSVLLNAGIPLLEAMETTARVTSNKIIERAMRTATRRMQDGGTIAETLRQTGRVPEPW